MIDGQGTVKLIDLATVHVAGLDEMHPGYAAADLVPGALQYAAPEYLLSQGGSPGPTCSLAVVTYRMLGGQLPGLDLARAAAGRAAAAALYPPRHHRPDPAGVARRGARQALQADPARRQAVISEFVHDLRAPGRSFAASAAPLIERNPVLFWQASTLVLAVALASRWRWPGRRA